MDARFPGPLDDATRERMRRYKRVDTKPELELRRALHAAGYRYRVDYPLRLDGGRPIRPDIVFVRARVAVFVDGCFWHACPEHGTLPANNRTAWIEKFRANRARDVAAVRRLQDAGWRPVRLWEHQSVDDMFETVSSALTETNHAKSDASDSPHRTG
jgi:DNA mismatch endonuclease (patch repair protein)